MKTQLVWLWSITAPLTLTEAAFSHELRTMSRKLAGRNSSRETDICVLTYSPSRTFQRNVQTLVHVWKQLKERWTQEMNCSTCSIPIKGSSTKSIFLKWLQLSHFEKIPLPNVECLKNVFGQELNTFPHPAEDTSNKNIPSHTMLADEWSCREHCKWRKRVPDPQRRDPYQTSLSSKSRQSNT